MGAGERVERAEWFIQQQHLGLHGQRAGDADALLHAARNLVRVFMRGRFQTYQRQCLIGAALQIGLGFLVAEHTLDRQINILEAGHPRQQ